MNPAYLRPVADHLWQSALFAGIVWLGTLALGKNHARVRHWLWLAASCKFLIPFSVLVALGGQLAWRTATPLTQSSLTVAMAEVSQPFSPSADAVRLVPPPSPARDLFPAVLAAVWICGFAGIAWAWCIRWRRILRTVGAASPVELRIPVLARSSPTVLEPSVFGVFRPVLLLPEGICERLTPAQFQAIVAHELCHIRYRDNLTASIHMLVETVFWFHPLVWWIGKRIVQERERACDQEVLELGSEPHAYAEGILDVCKHYFESPLQCVSGVTGSSLKPRIEAILANQKIHRMNFAKKAALAIAGTAAFLLPLGIGLLNSPRVQAQAPDAPVTPKFEVASIRPCQPGVSGRNSSPGRLSHGCEPLTDDFNLGLIQLAYVRFRGGHDNPVRILPVEGGPQWIHSEMFVIDATAEGHPSVAMMQGPMLQALLEDRFKLKIHRETRQGPVYELTAPKGVSKLKPFQEGSCTPMLSTAPFPPLPPQAYCQLLISPVSLNAEGSDLTEFSGLLSLKLDRPVIDKTGIAGKFDIHLRFSLDNATDSNDPTLFTAVQEQLGLKLVPAKGPIEVLVIDHVERPSEN
jgi:bla regulator protein blaR1